MKQALAILVALIGALALYSIFAARQVEQDYPPIGQFVEANGLRLHYLEAGTGPPIVLVHGASTNARDFKASLLPGLAEKHRVLAFDRPGHGYSERPAGDWPNPAIQASYLNAALEKLGIRQPLLVGHSWSGSLVLAYLLNYPDETAGGVLLAGGSHPWKGGVALTNDLAGVPVIGELFANTLVYPVGQLVLKGAIAEVFQPESPSTAYVERTGVMLSLRPQNFLANAQDLRLLSDYLRDQSQHYAKITQPLLIVHGTEDDIVPAWNHSDRLIKIIPQAELVRLDGVGHALHHTRTERITKLIQAFSKRVR